MAAIQPHEIPKHYIVPPGDVVVFYCRKDEVEAKELVRRVETAALLAGEEIKVYLYDDDIFKSVCTAFQSIEAFTSMAVEMWFLLTDSFIDDPLLQHYKDEALMNSILDPSKRCSVVPVFSKHKKDFLEIPYGFASLRGLFLQDSRLADRVLKRFMLPRHRALKENLVKKQEQGKLRWLVTNSERRPLSMDWDDCPSQQTNRTYHQKLDSIIELLQGLGHPDNFSNDNTSVDSEMPDHLHHSLNSMRSHQSHTTVYPITINQPHCVAVP